MTKAAFLDWLRGVERTYPVATWTTHGVRVWPLVRLQLLARNASASVLQDAVAGGAVGNAAAAARILRAWAGASLRDWRRHDRLHRADAVFLAYSSGTQPTIGGRKYNPLVAPYVELLRRAGRTAAVWEMCHEGEYNVPRATPSAFIQPALLGRRVASLFAYRPDPADAVLEGFEAFAADARRSGLANRYTTPAALLRDGYFVRRTADWFRRRLAIAAPAHGLVADYGLREQAFCLACREQGTPVVELQHGVVSDMHPAYASWDALPPGGYETRPSIFWCWDETGVRAIEAWAARPSSGARAVLGGDPWREQWMRDGDPLVRQFDAEVQRLKGDIGASLHVLVALDPTGPVIPDLLLDAMRSSPRDWCYWIRLHPLAQRARLPQARRALAAAGVRCAPLEPASEWPLHALLRHVDVHVTPYWSTVVMEAEDFGVASVACAERASEVFPRQVEDGTLRVILTEAELRDAIAAQAARRRPLRRERRADPAAAMLELLSSVPAQHARGRWAS